jgi:type II secretory pathway component GspD/PulD (secretin)
MTEQRAATVRERFFAKRSLTVAARYVDSMDIHGTLIARLLRSALTKTLDAPYKEFSMQRTLPLVLALWLTPFIADLNAQANAKSKDIEMIRLKYVRAITVERMLSAMKASAFPELQIRVQPDENAILLQGTAADIALAKGVIQKLDAIKKFEPLRINDNTFSYHDVPGGKAEAVAKELNEAYKENDSIRIMVATPTRLLVWADAKIHDAISKKLMEIGKREPKDAESKKSEPPQNGTEYSVVIPFKNLSPKTIDEALDGWLFRSSGAEVDPGMRGARLPAQGPILFGLNIEVDAKRKLLTLRGDRESVELMRSIIRIMDADPGKKDGAPKKAQAKGKLPAPGESSLRVYPVPGGHAESLAKLLQKVYPAPKVRISALGSNQIAVWADPQTHFEIAKQRPLTPAVTSMFPLKNVKAAKIAVTLRSMFSDPKTGGPFIEAETESNTVLVRGTIEQMEEIEAILARLDRAADRPRNMRVIDLDKGSGATVAEALSLLLPKLRANPVKIVIPGKEGEAAPPKKLEPEKKDAKEGKAMAPITITAFGNRLVVTSDDPDATELVAEVVRILLDAEVPICEAEIYRFQYAKADNVAKIIDKAFNGAAAKPGDQRVRVIADLDTNSIVLRATPIDRLIIVRLMRDLDVPAKDTK